MPPIYDYYILVDPFLRLVVRKYAWAAQEHDQRQCEKATGGSGTDDGDFQRAISAGITIVHINTELRLAWRQGLEAALAENSDEVVPYKIYGKSLSAMATVADKCLRLFNAG